jgi:capsular exopolysaccharide synthesis family protein
MNNSIVTFKTPKSPIAEAFRNMRTNITFSDIDNKLQVLAITSNSNSEGKSTIMSNYAVALAQSGKRVLLMDCDLRRPKLHRKFELVNNTGLTNVLLKEISVIDGIQKTEVSNLFVISSGPVPPNPSEILASQRMNELMEELKKDFHYILLDAPPIGIVTDAAVLNPVVDGYIVVVAIGSSHREGVKNMVDTLKKINANIIGIVANRVKVNKRNAYYGNYGVYDDLPKEKKKKKKK